jgi:hypothetical protein
VAGVVHIVMTLPSSHIKGGGIAGFVTLSFSRLTAFLGAGRFVNYS